MGIICSHQTDIVLLGKLNKSLVGLNLLLHAVVLNFNKEIIPAKNLQIILQGLFRPVHIATENPGRNFPRNAGAEANNAIMILTQQFFVYTGLVIHALNIGLGNQLHQILVASFIFSQQNKVIVLCTIHLKILPTIPGSHINLAANNGIYALRLGSLIKINNTEHIAMVSNGQVLHSQLLGPLHQWLYSVCPIQQAILSMNMQMGKWYIILKHTFFHA